MEMVPYDQEFELIIRYGPNDNINTVREWLTQCLCDKFDNEKIEVMIRPITLHNPNYKTVSGILTISHTTCVPSSHIRNILAVTHPTIQIEEVTRISNRT